MQEVDFVNIAGGTLGAQIPLGPRAHRGIKRMKASGIKKSKNHGLIIRELDRLFEQTGDERFVSASRALREYFPSLSKRGRPTEWTPTRLMLLWAEIQNLVVRGMTISAACSHLCNRRKSWGTKGRVEARYYEAKRFIEENPRAKRQSILWQPYLLKIKRYKK